MIKTLTCIVCPVGCKIEAEVIDSKVERISGYACPRGKVYGISECTNPVRTLTTTILTENGGILPVKTDKPVPKEKLMDCMSIINTATAPLPVKIGTIIIKNIADTDANVVAAKNMR